MLCVRISCVSFLQLFLSDLRLIIDLNTVRTRGIPKSGFSPQDKRRRKSNKELEDFHGSQALDGGRRPQTDRQNQGGACGCRAQTCLGKDGEEPVNLASSILLICVDVPFSWSYSPPPQEGLPSEKR
ncbi:uncharacterized protein LOC129046378 [Mirounga angustirostris]|uniref:uncharacterized protein LOC129046378 n=1 Tax=Mirounga angustirostris TaxID=9716 RepID=UPI00313B2466